MQDAPSAASLPGWLGAVLAVAAVGATVVTAFMPAIIERMRRGRKDDWAEVLDEAMDDLRADRDHYRKECSQLRARVLVLEAKVRTLGGEP